MRGGVLLLGCVVDAFVDVTLLSIKHSVHDDGFRTGLSFVGRVLLHHRSLPENTFHGRSPGTDVLAGIASGRG